MTRKRVALINPRVEPRQHIPINLLTLAGFVDDICDVRVFDPEIDDKSLADIKDFQPDLLGFTAMTQTFARAKELVQILRKDLPDRRYIMGGIHPTVLPDVVLQESGVDAVVVGEGEYTLKELIEDRPPETIQGLHYAGHANPTRPLIANLDELPLPAYHRMPDFEKYMIPPGTIRGTWQKRGTIALMSARGCPARCIFCNSHIMFGRKIRRRSVSNMISEIELILRNYGRTSFWFADDTFTLQKEWVRDFCERASRLSITWGCQVRSDTVSDEMVDFLKLGGCAQVDIGVESGSDRVLKLLQKGTTRERHLKAFEILRRKKLRAMGTFIIGTPGETREDVMLTKSLVQEAKPAFALFFFMMPYPGSAVYEMAEQHNLWLHKDYTKLGVQDCPMIADQLTAEEQIKLRNDLISVTKWRNMASFLSLQFMWGLLSMLSVRRVAIFLKTLGAKRNIYDAMFAFVQDFRLNYFRKHQRPDAASASPAP